MKGEFVGVDGQRWWLDGVALHRQDGGGPACFYPNAPDFPAAVAALQSLIRPSVHPGVGLRYCDGSVDAVIYHFWIDADGMHWEEAGRVYERERG